MSDNNVQGAIRILNHIFKIQVWVEQGGGWDDLVAWCSVCDPPGANVIKVNVRDVGGPHELFETLMRQITAHAFVPREGLDSTYSDDVESASDKDEHSGQYRLF